jgi:hypothetical protein
MSGLPIKPSQDPIWATVPTAGDLTAPSGAKQILGWIQEKPPLQYFNWWMNLVYQWQQYLYYRLPHGNMIKVTASGSYAVPLGQSLYLFMDCTLGNQTATLPTPVTGTDDGMIVRIKRLDASGNTITWGGTVEGVASSTVDQQYTEEAVIAFQGLWYWIA